MIEHRIKGPDGRIHIVKAPADADPQKLVAFVAKHARQPVEFDAGKMVENLGPSAKQYGADIWNAVTSPVETAKTLGSLGLGVWDKGQRKIQEMAAGVDIPPTPGEEETIDAMIDVMKDRYGSMDAIKKTAMEDPVGFAADFATILAPVASAPGKVGQVGRVAQMGDLGNLATKGVRAAGKLIPEDTATKLYAKAAKIGPGAKNRQRVLDTLVRERIKPTKRGIRDFEEKLADWEGRLDELVKGATADGRMIPKEKLFQHVDGLFDSLGGVKAQGLRKQGKVMDVVSEAMDNIGDRRLLTPEEVQAFKIDLYDDIWARRISPEATKRTGVKTEAMSELARGARQGLEEVMPEAAEVNQMLGDLYTARPQLARAQGRLENRNIIPTRALFGGAAGGFKGAVASALIDQPALKAKLSFAIDALKKGDIMKAERGLNSNEIRTAMRLSEMTEDELREIGFD